MWSLSLLYSAARFAENILDLLEQVGGAVGLGENFKVFQFRAIAQALVVEQSAHHQDPHFRALAAQIYSGVMTRQPLNVGACQQEVRLAVFQAVNRLT